MIHSLWRYRYFIIGAIKSELIARFSRSKLGAIWMVINPLAQVLIYALILSNVLAAKLPGIENKYSYSIYLMAGLLAWTLFHDIVSRLLTLFIEQGNLMKKMSFPRITLPTIVVGSSLLNNLLLFIAMLGIFVLLNQQFNPVILWLIPLTLVIVILSIGLGLVLGIINVFLRDTGQVVPIVLQMWFWFTPIVYPISIIPQKYHDLLILNPMYPMTSAYQQILVYGQAPSLDSIAITAAVGCTLTLLGLFIFRRANAEMVDVL